MSAPRRRFASTRVRLTAWYAALLVVVLLALGMSVDTLARNRLMADVDRRLTSTAQDIGAVIEGDLASKLSQFERNRALWPFANGSDRFQYVVPDLGSFASRGLVVQIMSPQNEVVRSTNYAPDVPLVAAPGGAASSDEPHIVSTHLSGDDARAVRYPLTIADNDGKTWQIGAVIVGEHLTTMHETIASLRQVLLATSVLGLILAIAGGWVLAGRALRPVDHVTAAAAAIAAGDGTATSLSARLPVPPTNDELARLSATFNAMLDRLQASFQAQERFVGDASHELRTPLTAIRGNVDVLMRQTRPGARAFDAGDLAPALDDIRRESDRMRRLLDDLLLLARGDVNHDVLAAAPAQREPVRLDAIAAEAVRSAQALASGQIIELEAPRRIEMTADGDRLHQLMMILLDNAIRHTPPGGHVRVAIAATPNGEARLAVRDEGEGIAAEHLPHIFERFYRADGARGRSSGGTGLGLAIAQAIVRAHGGDIEVTSSPGRGTTFMATLPCGLEGTPATTDRRSRPVPSRTAESTPSYKKKYQAALSNAMPPTMSNGRSTPATDDLLNPRP
ncbi:MAG: histidine kinase [Thermomicrobiales bacterium]|nr:histidine kinase [Thermomicrobiales bacterium]